MEAGFRIGALLLAQFLEDVLNLANLVLRALARVHVGDVDDGFFLRLQHLDDFVGVGGRVEDVADIELLEV